MKLSSPLPSLVFFTIPISLVTALCGLPRVSSCADVLSREQCASKLAIVGDAIGANLSRIEQWQGRYGFTDKVVIHEIPLNANEVVQGNFIATHCGEISFKLDRKRESVLVEYSVQDSKIEAMSGRLPPIPTHLVSPYTVRTLLTSEGMTEYEPELIVGPHPGFPGVPKYLKESRKLTFGPSDHFIKDARFERYIQPIQIFTGFVSPRRIDEIMLRYATRAATPESEFPVAVKLDANLIAVSRSITDSELDMVFDAKSGFNLVSAISFPDPYFRFDCKYTDQDGVFIPSEFHLSDTDDTGVWTMNRSFKLISSDIKSRIPPHAFSLSGMSVKAGTVMHDTVNSQVKVVNHDLWLVDIPDFAPVEPRSTLNTLWVLLGLAVVFSTWCVSRVAASRRRAP